MEDFLFKKCVSPDRKKISEEGGRGGVAISWSGPRLLGRGLSPLRDSPHPAAARRSPIRCRLVRPSTSDGEMMVESGETRLAARLSFSIENILSPGFGLKKPPETSEETVWPAWVYCTRYSVR
ncbi:unnamed protein product [Nezara viridula]|uniref:Uncharacterized protein n=1 Tax=Nezara viridula TaxID=85310 RepID=A0A9P0MUH7_NEZVI|nr:unnamed protein product [Nezara viridula]